MKLKLDENGHVVVADGKPVYTHDDGKEIPFDAPQAMSKIRDLNGESRSHRERAEAAESVVKAFEGIDPEAARKAMDTIANIDQKKLVDAGQIDQVRAEISKVYDQKLADQKKITERLERDIRNEKIGGSFARSKLIADKLAIPADMVEAKFGSAFKLEDGKVVAYGADGNKVFSRINPGSVADFDEALELIIEQYPNRDHILKGTGASGSGAQGGGSGGASGQKQINRASFDALNPAKQMEHIKGGGTITD